MPPSAFRSASTGPTSSTRISTVAQANITPTLVSASARTTHPTWLNARVIMIASAIRRRSGSWRAARAHWKIMGTRMMT